MLLDFGYIWLSCKIVLLKERGVERVYFTFIYDDTHVFQNSEMKYKFFSANGWIIEWLSVLSL